MEETVIDYESVTLGKALRRAAGNWPQQEFLVSGNTRLTFAEVDVKVDHFAQGLLDLGMKRGDHMAVWLTNSVDWVLALFAAARIGMVVIPINTRYRTQELQYILRQSDAKILIMMDKYWDIDFYDMMTQIAPGLSQQDPRCLQMSELPKLRSILLWGDARKPGTLSLMGMLKSKPEAALQAAEFRVQASEPVLICYTSGTTGRPKGAMHSHIVLKQSENVAKACHMKAGETALGHMPFYHVAGLFMVILPAVLRGMRLIIMPEWNVDHALDILEQERCAHFGGIPTHYIDCFDAQKKRPRDLSHIKTSWIGGTAVTPEVVRQARSVLRTPHILASYGMTETTISTTFTQFQDSPEVAEQNKGRLTGDFEAKIVDPRNGSKVPAGEIGELLIRGHIVTLGYYKNPEATQAAFSADGWFKTDDLGFFDKDGYLKITGRIKEMFIVGGSNAYPAEIQQHIETHPAVRQSLVVGVTHDRLGQVGYAFLQLEPGASVTSEEIICFCKGAIADYKVPRYVSFVQNFPMTESGKIKRHVLVEQAEATVAQIRLERASA